MGIQFSRTDYMHVQPLPLICADNLFTEQFHMIPLPAAIGYMYHVTRNTRCFKFVQNPKHRFPFTIVHIKAHKPTAPLASKHTYCILAVLMVQ